LSHQNTGSFFGGAQQHSQVPHGAWLSDQFRIATKTDTRNDRAAGLDTMIFDVRQPSITETLERMEWMAKEVFPKV
jgi:hypothetical protein